METSARASERAGLLLIGAAVAVVALYLLGGVSAAIYRAVVPHTADLPGIGWPAEAGILVLLALFAVLAVRLWRARSPQLVDLLLGGAGVIVAYALSEVLKAFVAEERPCRAELALPSCPAPGDWSFPSNHTTIAVGLATAVVLAAGGLLSTLQRGLVIALAALVGLDRILQGAHYPHDVLAGAVLGASVTFAVVVMLGPWAHAQVRTRVHRAPAVGADA